MLRVKVSQTIPSMNCCMPKRRGSDAKGISDFVFAFFTVAIPIADIEAPAIKLADAEKHIPLAFYYD